MPSFAANLEKTLHAALDGARERRHEYATLEHLLLALIADEDAAEVMGACGVDLAELADVVRSPRYSTVLGLLQEAKKQYLRGYIVTRQEGSVKAVWQRMKEWFLGNF